MKALLLVLLYSYGVIAITFQQIDIPRPNPNNVIAMPSVVDFNYDGLNDIIVHTATSTGGQFHSLINNGDYNFTTNLLFSYSYSFYHVFTAVDIDNDNDIDIVKFLIVSSSSAQVVAHVNNNGVFSQTTLTGPINSFLSLAVVDINSDGKPDLVVSSQPKIFIYLNQKCGSFAATANFSHAATSDGNDDCHPAGFVPGKLPLTYPNVVFAGCWSGTVKYISFDGTNFQQTIIGGNYNSISVGLADFNGDLIQDIVSAGVNCWNVNWYAAGSWASGNLPSSTIPNCFHRSFVSAGDLDGDGYGDIVSEVDNTVYVISNVRSASGVQTLGLFSSTSIAGTFPVYVTGKLYNNAIGNLDLLLNNGGSTLSIFTSCRNCSICPAGSYVDANGVCTACATEYLSKPGSRTCYRVCSAGLAGTYPNCTECPSGTYSKAGNMSCTACPLNQISTGVGCQSCPINTYPSNSQTICTVCPLGFYAPAGSTSCSTCATGSIRGNCDSACVICPAGTYAAGYVCTPCPAGSYASVAGALGCLACASGTFSAVGASSCTPCPLGYASTSSRTLCYLP